MRLHRGVWAGACLLLALVGCSDGPSDEVKGHGVYSPVITGIASNNEPVARAVPNQLTVQVTNVNNLPLTYHWSVASGSITDTTNVTATWTPLDSVAVYNVTVSIEAHDGDAYFFKTMTVAMSVDNQYIRWTKSDQIQQDPAPVPGGGVLFSEIHNTSTGSSDAYRVDSPQGLATQLTTGFFSVGFPTSRSDRVQIGFAGKTSSNTAVPTIYLLPFNGGDAANAIAIAAPNQTQTILRNPRFAPTGTRIAYVSDSLVIPYPKIWWRDAGDLATAPVATVSTYLDPAGDPEKSSPLFFNVYLSPSWGPDVTGEGNPDYMLTVAADPFGNVSGLTKLSLPDTGNVWVDNPWLFSNQMQTPDWSPDGQYVAFAQKNAGTNERDIWIISANSTDLSTAVRVTSGPADDSQPRFSEDSKRIFFVSNRVDHYGANGVQGVERRGRNIWSVAEFDKP